MCALSHWVGRLTVLGDTAHVYPVMMNDCLVYWVLWCFSGPVHHGSHIGGEVGGGGRQRWCTVNSGHTLCQSSFPLRTWGTRKPPLAQTNQFNVPLAPPFSHQLFLQLLCSHVTFFLSLYLNFTLFLKGRWFQVGDYSCVVTGGPFGRLKVLDCCISGEKARGASSFHGTQGSEPDDSNTDVTLDQASGEDKVIGLPVLRHDASWK